MNTFTAIVQKVRITVLSCFIVSALHGQTTINAVQYWFDQNQTSGETLSLQPGSYVVWDASIDASALSPGLHTFHYRFRDSEDRWSSVSSSFFLHTGSGESEENVLTEIEYWFDQNYDDRVTLATSATALLNLETDLDCSTLSSGIHTIHLRVKDSANRWSSVLSQFLTKSPSTGGANAAIAAYEYWFDNDYDNAVFTSVDAGPIYVLMSSLNTETISAGLHTIHIRFQDESGKWSSVLSQFIQKNSTVSGNAEIPAITGYRYWFDEDTDAMTSVTVENPSTSFELETALDLSTSLPKGDHELHFQFADSLGRWSSVVSHPFYKFPFVVSQFSGADLFYCDEGQVSFINESFDADEFLWDFGNGQTSEEFEPSIMYDEPGVYDITLTATDLTEGVVTVQTLEDYVVIGETPVFELGEEIIACADQVPALTAAPDAASYLWNTGESTQSIIPTEPGEYWAQASDAFGCTFEDTVSVTIEPLAVADFSFDADELVVTFTNLGSFADSFSWNFGDTQTSGEENPVHTYTESGEYTVVLTASNSCGSDEATQVIFVTTDIAEREAVSLSIYPNPARDVLVAETSSGMIQRVRIFDAAGALVLDSTPRMSRAVMDVNWLPAGAYIIQITSDEMERTLNFIKH
jgi:PKD repeat protein